MTKKKKDGLLLMVMQNPRLFCPWDLDCAFERRKKTK